MAFSYPLLLSLHFSLIHQPQHHSDPTHLKQMGSSISKKEETDSRFNVPDPVPIFSRTKKFTSQKKRKDLDLDDVFRHGYFEHFPENSSFAAGEEWLHQDQLLGLDAETYSADRIKRNREHAKKSRRRHNLLMESLQGQVQVEINFHKCMICNADRIKRNREHARKSRLRQQYLMEKLQGQVQGEVDFQKVMICKECPDKAEELHKTVIKPQGNVMQTEFVPLITPDHRLMLTFTAISDPNLPDTHIINGSQHSLLAA